MDLRPVLLAMFLCIQNIIALQFFNQSTETLDAGIQRQFGVFGGFPFEGRRLKLALMPIMYKMGVMSTMLAVLIAITLKGLLIGVILLVLYCSNLLAKLKIANYEEQHGHQKKQDIHLHFHGNRRKEYYNLKQHYPFRDYVDGHHPPYVYDGWMDYSPDRQDTEVM